MGSKSANATWGNNTYEVVCSRSTDTYYVSVNGETKAISFETMKILLELIGDSAGAAACEVDMIKEVAAKWLEMYGD